MQRAAVRQVVAAGAQRDAAAHAQLAVEHEAFLVGAVAVLSVLVYHAFPHVIPGGYVGVDVFFVISGYLITSILAQEWRNTGRIDLPAFYARRVRRLLPALGVVLVATVAVAAVVLPRLGRFQDFAESAIASTDCPSNGWPPLV